MVRKSYSFDAHTCIVRGETSDLGRTGRIVIRGELEVRLVASAHGSRRGPVRFDVAPTAAGVRILGGFSMGDDGWSLAGYARSYRNRILASVVATQSTGRDEREMSEIDYELDICRVKPGRHLLQVRHVFRPPTGEGVATDLVVFESVVVVAPS